MGIRETLNDKPQIATGIAGGIIAIAFIFILWQIFGGSSNSVGTVATEAWYTTDDGKTMIPGPIDGISPIKLDGKDAHRLYVFTCDDGETKIITHLERFTPEARKKLEDITKKMVESPTSGEGGPPPDIAMREMLMGTGKEIKKANDPSAKWISAMNPAAYSINSPKCPDGQSSDNLRPWLPMDE